MSRCCYESCVCFNNLLKCIIVSKGHSTNEARVIVLVTCFTSDSVVLYAMYDEGGRFFIFNIVISILKWSFSQHFMRLLFDSCSLFNTIVTFMRFTAIFITRNCDESYGVCWVLLVLIDVMNDGLY